MLAPQILALMLTVGPAPGVSPYSVVETTETARLCADIHKPACRRPWYSAWHKSLVRQENRAEALARYLVIARAVVAVAGRDLRMTRLLLTVTQHESGWRRDVHSGLGAHAKGDGGRSWGLVQALLGRYSREGPQLVGVGIRPTTRALAWAAVHLRRCSRSADPIDVFACYGGVRDGRRHKGIMARAGTFLRYAAPPPLLSAEDCKQLGILPVVAVDGKPVRLCEQRSGCAQSEGGV